MNQRLLNSLITAALMTASLPIASSQAAQTQVANKGSEANAASIVGESLAGGTSALQTGSFVGESIASVPPALQTASLPSSAKTPKRPISVKVGQYQGQAVGFSDSEAIAKVYPHIMAGRKAATLSVRNIPVLTFLDATEDDAMWRANAIAAKINQLSRDNVDASAITVTPYEGDTYLIQVNGQDLVAIDAQTILPDTTRNAAEDALQATNRLRRLLGNAEPLREIPGLAKRTEPTYPAEDNPTEISPEPVLERVTGWASWYGPGFHGNYSASGEIFDENDLTAAHLYLPFGTKVRVTNLDNGRSVVVRINDRGPYVDDRIIDLSAAAAETIGMLDSGVAPVSVEVIGDRNAANFR